MHTDKFMHKYTFKRQVYAQACPYTDRCMHSYTFKQIPTDSLFISIVYENVIYKIYQ